MRGNTILLSAEPQGRFIEGQLVGALKPGICVEIDPTKEMVGGRFHYRPYQPGGDGQRATIIVLLEDHLQGKGPTEAYADGDRGFMYAPVSSEELNILLANQSGTADAFSLGDRLILEDGTGKGLATTGTPESEPFELAEDVSALTADALAFCIYTGH